MLFKEGIIFVLFFTLTTSTYSSQKEDRTKKTQIVSFVRQPSTLQKMPHGAIVIDPTALAAFQSHCQQIQAQHSATKVMMQRIEADRAFIEKKLEIGDSLNNAPYALLALLSRMGVKEVNIGGGNSATLPELETPSGLVRSHGHDSPASDMMAITWVSFESACNAFMQKMEQRRQEERNTKTVDYQYPVLGDYTFPDALQRTIKTEIIKTKDIYPVVTKLLESETLTTGELAALMFLHQPQSIIRKEGMCAPFPATMDVYTNEYADTIHGRTNTNLVLKLDVYHNRKISGITVDPISFKAAVLSLFIKANIQQDEVTQSAGHNLSDSTAPRTSSASKVTSDSQKQEIATVLTDPLKSAPSTFETNIDDTIPSKSFTHSTVSNNTDYLKSLRNFVSTYKKPLLYGAGIGAIIATYGTLYKNGRTAPGMAPFAFAFKKCADGSNWITTAAVKPTKNYCVHLYTNSMLNKGLSFIENKASATFNILCPKIENAA